VQGRLKNAPVSVRIESRCAVCKRELCVIADQDLGWQTPGTNGRLLIFEPSVDWSRLRARTIIDDY
jgi:hypothetical protein